MARLPIGLNRPPEKWTLERRHDEMTGQWLLWVMIPARVVQIPGPGGVPVDVTLPAEEHEIGLDMQPVILADPTGNFAALAAGHRLSVAARDEPKYSHGRGQELNCVVNATDYQALGLSGGDLIEVTAHNGTIFIGWLLTTADENKLIAVPAGTTHRFTIPNDRDHFHYSTEDGAGVLGRMSVILDEA